MRAERAEAGAGDKITPHSTEGREQELARRRAALAAALREHSCDALIATRVGTVAYLSGYHTATWSNFSRPVVAVLGGERLAMVVAETEVDAVRERVPGADVRAYVELRRVREGAPLPDGRVQFAPHAIEVLRALLAEWDVADLLVDGLDAAFPPVAQVTTLLDTATYRVSDASALLWQHRLIKSRWEVDRMRQSCAVLGRAFGHLEEELRPGMTEREIHARLAAAAFRSGADALGYTNVVAGVDRGLFGAPGDKRWEPGEVLYVDGGVVMDGYWADFCRMYVAGSATSRQTQGYQRAVDGLESALDGFHPGMTAGALAESIAAASGLPPGEVGFGRFGHGIGLYMPEPPSLHPLDDTPLQEGMVVCIEPAVAHHGANYVVEEEYAIRDGHLERISPQSPGSLLVVG